MLKQLQEAVDNDRTKEIVDLTHALNAFMPVYIDNWDRKLKVAWDHVVK
jgi:kynurenine formamidase